MSHPGSRMVNDRAGTMLRGVAVAGLCAAAGVCAVVFVVHQSADPWLLRWSRRYVIGAILPVLGVIAAQMVLILWPRLYAGRDRWVALGSLVAGGLLLVLGVEILPLYELPIMAAFLALMTIPLAGYRVFRTNQWLLSFITLTILCLVLFVPEVVSLLAGGRAPGDHRQPHWGDQVTFRHLFPSEEPFISSGGRLRPKLDVDVTTGIPGRPTYHMKTNSDGFRNDRDIPAAKDPGELRILSLGDSYSTGYGVGQDAFIGPLLESKWRQEHPGGKITILNAEVSDPAYALLHLQRYGVGYSPDVVLYGYVDNDSHQAYVPFAARRIFSLDENGVVRTHPIDLSQAHDRSVEAEQRFAQHQYPKVSLARIQLDETSANTWMARLTASLREFRLFAALESLTRPTGNDHDGQLTFISTAWPHSEGHLRLIDFATNFGMLYKNGDAVTAPLYENLFRVFASMNESAAKHGATFVLAYFPRREQVQPQDWEQFRSFWNLDPADFDLDLESTRLRAFCEAHGIPFIDTTPALRAAAVERGLYLPHDTHFNEYGQAVAAQAIWEFIQSRLTAKGDGS